MKKRRSVPTPKPEATTFPLRMPKALDEKMAAGANRTGLSKSDFMRMSMERGAELVIKALSLTAEQLACLPEREAEQRDAA